MLVASLSFPEDPLCHLLQPHICSSQLLQVSHPWQPLTCLCVYNFALSQMLYQCDHRVHSLFGFSLCTQHNWRYICIVAGVNGSLFCIILWIPWWGYITVCLTIQLSKDFWVVCSVGLLEIRQLPTFVYKVFLNVSHPFGGFKCPGMEFLGHMVVLCFVLRNYQTVPEWLYHFSIISTA